MPKPIVNETWKPINGYAGLYSVSSCGRVRSDAVSRYVRTGYMLKGFVNWLGYRVVTLNRAGKKRHAPVHRLVAAAFIGPCPKGKEVNHKNSDPADNHATSLEYLTHKENIHHAMKYGSFNHRGSNSLNTHLSEADVQAMRKRHAAGGITKAALAKQYRLDTSTAARIINRRTWTHC